MSLSSVFVNYCGGLNQNGSPSLIYLNSVPNWNCLERISRCGLVGKGVSREIGFEVSKVKAIPS